MSIINDALKKTQENLSQNSPISPSDPLTPREKSKGPWITVAFFLIAILGGGILYFYLSSSKNQNIMFPAQTAVPSAPPPAEEPLSPPETESLPEDESAQNSSEKLTLNGIISMGDGNMALINNQIYKAGDKILDTEMRVVNIQANRVEIENRGETLFLTTK